MKPTIVLDCDPGHDDAIALLIAGRHCELLGVTTVSGNVPLELTTRNALITLQLLGLEVPVHAGAARPLVAEARHAEFIHGDTGLNGPQLPPLERTAAGTDAAGFIIEAARSRDDLWLVASGPLTNVALALRRAPDLSEQLAGIALMGGSTSFGNVTAAAEFNIWADPEAADMVFRSGARLIMAGLDLTHQFTMGAGHIECLRQVGSGAATFAADLLTFFSNAYAEAYSGRAEGPLHDPCAVMALTHPELFESQDHHVVVELRGDHTRGMTLTDTRAGRRGEAPNVRVLKRIDADAAFEVLLESAAGYR